MTTASIPIGTGSSHHEDVGLASRQDPPGGQRALGILIHFTRPCGSRCGEGSAARRSSSWLEPDSPAA